MPTPLHPFTQTLLQWFAAHQRQMPWRHCGDPYAIWLSEVILQQTRVQQGWDYWQRFMQRFPTVELLAAASQDEVLRLWQGLGYYSRARHLHEAARQIVALGRFPDTYEALRALSGVGPYTAAAVASLAFGLPYPALDGNAYRVLARHFGIPLPIHSTQGQQTFLALARELIPADRAADFNLAMMDFGSLQCTPSSPLCEQCPLLLTCIAARDGKVAQLPVRPKPGDKKTRRFQYIYIRCQGYTAIHQRLAGDIWQGLWEPPLTEATSPNTEGPLATTTLPCSPEAEGAETQLLAEGIRHVLTHQIILASLRLWQPPTRPPLPPDFRWIPEEQLVDYALPRLVEKLLAFLP